MTPRPPRSTLTATLFPDTSLSRSYIVRCGARSRHEGAGREAADGRVGTPRLRQGEPGHRAGDDRGRDRPAGLARRSAAVSWPAHAAAALQAVPGRKRRPRSEERRVGKEWVSKCRSRRWPNTTKKKKQRKRDKK